MSKQESYSNYDKIILHVNENVANELNDSIQKELRKLRFGFDADINGFRAEYDIDESELMHEAETLLIRNKIPYKRIYVKANIDSYVSNT